MNQVQNRRGQILEMNEELEHVILTNPVDVEIHKVARKQGMLTMAEDGVLKVIEGITSLEELERVVELKT